MSSGKARSRSFVRRLETIWRLSSLGGVALYFGLWLLLVGKAQTAELAAAVLAAGLATVSARVVRARKLARFAVRYRWVKEAPRVPWAVLSGTLHLFGALARYCLGPNRGRRVRFTTQTVPFDLNGTADGVAARRAMVIVYTNTSPDLFVVDIEGEAPNGGRMIYHGLQGRVLPPMVCRLGARP